MKTRKRSIQTSARCCSRISAFPVRSCCRRAHICAISAADFDKHKNSDFINALGELLPRKIIPAVIEKSGIDPREKVNTITKKQRASLLRVLKCFPVEISGKRPIAEAIVTTGGVSVREVSPKTMESKKCSGLYFAGEVLDVDAYTGGFNLQIAWSTGRLAGLSAAQEEEQA